MAFLVTFSVRAAPRMGELMKHEGESGLSFRQVSDLAAALSNEKLVRLATEIGTGRTHGMRGWARAALYQQIGVALMRGDARLAPDVAKMNYRWFPGSLSHFFPAAATMMRYDLYPVPENNPTLPSHQVRYEAFREAMKVGGLSGKTMESTKRSLDGSFRYTVPAAQKAYDLAQGN